MNLTDTCWVYDFLLVRGGAETVTVEVARHWPQVDVCVATRNPEVPAPGVTIRTLSGQRPSRHPLLRAAQTKRLFRRSAATFGDYRQVVFSGMFAPLAQLAAPARRAVYYCHTTPLPYAFDWQADYRARLPRPARWPFDRFARREREVFSRAILAMDKVIANSRFVAERYHHHLGVSAEVIYPPVAVEDFDWRAPGEYFVLIGALEPHKGVDLAIRAFRRRNERLLVIGDGSQRRALERLAADEGNIRLLGAVDRGRLVELLAGCRASLCVSRGEAFGLAAVESLAAGKPVIAVADGAYPELIEDGVTGTLIEPADEAIRTALDSMTPARAMAMRDSCRRRAGDFSPSRFHEAMEQLLRDLP